MSKTVVRDIDLNTFEVDSNELQLRVSVYGLLKNEDDAILFQKNPHFNRLNLPGGALEKGEALYAAVIREFLEETGYSVSVSKLLHVEQDFFTYGGVHFQSICLFYEVRQSSKEVVAIDRQEGDSESAIWLPPSSLNLDNIQPIFRNIVKQYLCL